MAQLEWTGGLNANINGPTVDFDTFFSGRGVLEFPANATKQASAAKFGLSYQIAAFTPATGWTNVPASMNRPAQQTVLTVASSSASSEPDPHVRPLRVREREQRLRPRGDGPDRRRQGRNEGRGEPDAA